MTYDPLTYWPERYRTQGDTYVAKGGTADSYVEQLEAVEPILRAYLPTSGRVLDFGCGPGRFRPTLEAHGLVYDGYDIISELSTVGRVKPETYDCAIAVYVLQHIVDEAEYMAALLSVRLGLRPGGMFLVVDHNPMDSPAEHMNPRGFGRVHEVFPGPFILTEGPDNHWVGVFTK